MLCSKKFENRFNSLPMLCRLRQTNPRLWPKSIFSLFIPVLNQSLHHHQQTSHLNGSPLPSLHSHQPSTSLRPFMKAILSPLIFTPNPNPQPSLLFHPLSASIQFYLPRFDTYSHEPSISPSTFSSISSVFWAHRHHTLPTSSPTTCPPFHSSIPTLLQSYSQQVQTLSKLASC